MESTLDGRDLRVSEFKELGNRVGAAELGPQDAAPAKTLSTYALVADPTRVNLGELAWRVGLALAALNFVVIAVTVSSVNPRAGRSGNLVFALFAFIVYYNLLNLGQSWITTGRATFGPFMAGLHGGVLLLAGSWLAKQHNNWAWLRLPRPWRRSA